MIKHWGYGTGISYIKNFIKARGSVGNSKDQLHNLPKVGFKSNPLTDKDKTEKGLITSKNYFQKKAILSRGHLDLAPNSVTVLAHKHMISKSKPSHKD